MNQAKTKIHSIDALRTISILGVILIHSTTKTLEFAHYDLLSYQTTLFLNQMARFSVPLFFIISGFVLELNYHLNESWVTFLKKRAFRIVMPYIFWSIIYYFLVYTDNHDNFLKVLLTGNASYQLYFIPTLCIYYLVFPFLHKIYDFIFNKFFFLMLTVVQMNLMYQDYVIKQLDYPEPVRILVLSFIYFLSGIFLARNKDKVKEFARKYLLIIITALVYLAVFIFNEGKNHYFETYNIKAFYSQWRSSIFIYSLGIFASLYYLFSLSDRYTSLINRVSKLSFSVFFIHVIILEAIWVLLGREVFGKLNGNVLGLVFFDPLFFLVIAIISFGISFLIHSIPKLSKITG